MEDLDDSVDHHEGVYDSSKKQRVPSWVSLRAFVGDLNPDVQCDRVLWKVHVMLDSKSKVQAEDLAPAQSRFNRLSQAFSFPV